MFLENCILFFNPSFPFDKGAYIRYCLRTLLFLIILFEILTLVPQYLKIHKIAITCIR